jgi:mannose/fructose/N-acetylgalactosamine-specific phosphotransferase system component IIC
MTDWFPLSLLLGLLALDTTAVGQFMVSRAIVVGPLVGWILGDPGLGLALGALVELIWAGDLPVGSHLPLDTTLLAGVGSALAVGLVRTGVGPEAAVTYALCVGIPLAALSSEAENLLRKAYVRIVRQAQHQVEAGHLATFESVNVGILLSQWAKGWVTAALALAAAHGALSLFPNLPAEVITGLSYAPWFLMATGCAAALDLLVDPKHLIPLMISAVAASGLVLFLHVPVLYLLPVSLLAGFFFSIVRIRRERRAA